ncbi:MAG: peptidoglycan DD-metalloendopeptidase family protein [Rhodococcus sp. (in: high G+C Gram-positive bacteria)]
MVALALLTALPAAPSAARPSETGAMFSWPLEPRPRVVNAFDPPQHDWLPGHRGVDLGGRHGQPVHAAGAGIVVFAGTVAGKPVVSIDHPNGLRTTYEPVVASTRRGDRVRVGDPIGNLDAGHAGCPDPCLHWGVRRDRVYLDPTALLNTTPIRLKPLGGLATRRAR